jgi:hypothetical protein
MLLTVQSENEKVAIIVALVSREEEIQREIIRSVREMNKDLDNGGKDYWTEKLMDLSVDLITTENLLLRVRSLKPAPQISEEDL